MMDTPPNLGVLTLNALAGVVACRVDSRTRHSAEVMRQER